MNFFLKLFLKFSPLGKQISNTLYEAVNDYQVLISDEIYIATTTDDSWTSVTTYENADMVSHRLQNLKKLNQELNVKSKF